MCLVYEEGRQKDCNPKDFKPRFIFRGTQFWSVTIYTHLHFAAFWKDLLVICIRLSSVQYWQRFRRTEARNYDVIDLTLVISKTAEICRLKMCSVVQPSDYCSVQDAANPVGVSI